MNNICKYVNCQMEVYEVQRFLQEYRMFRMAVVLIAMMCHTLAIRIFRITEHSTQGFINVSAHPAS